MRKGFYAAIILLCTTTFTGCGGEVPQDTTAFYRQEASNPSEETTSPDTGTDMLAGTVPADTVLSQEAQAVLTTVSAYLNGAEELWQSVREQVDHRTAYGNEALDQRQAVNLQEDYGCELILSEDFAETGDFTFSLSVDGTDDGLYVLEGSQDYASIVFGEAYLLDNTLYIGVGSYDNPVFALNLETKTLTDCKKEYETLETLFSDWLQGQPEDTGLRIRYCHPIARVDGCLMYIATISEAMDAETRAVIYAAFDESRSLRAYLLLGAE